MHRQPDSTNNIWILSGCANFACKKHSLQLDIKWSQRQLLKQSTSANLAPSERQLLPHPDPDLCKLPTACDPDITTQFLQHKVITNPTRFHSPKAPHHHQPVFSIFFPTENHFLHLNATHHNCVNWQWNGTQAKENKIGPICWVMLIQLHNKKRQRYFLTLLICSSWNVNPIKMFQRKWGKPQGCLGSRLQKSHCFVPN